MQVPLLVHYSGSLSRVLQRALCQVQHWMELYLTAMNA
ncbi:hypothetical protein [Morganella morganii IS15]|nr:hypothetical protein [Morganella morganii IS15]